MRCLLTRLKDATVKWNWISETSGSFNGENRVFPVGGGGLSLALFKSVKLVIAVFYCHGVQRR